MAIETLSCPQCGAPLPRQARWRMVNCAHCGAMVSRREDVVQASAFKAARARAAAIEAQGPTIRVGGGRFRLEARLGRGQHADVHLATHLGAPWGRFVLKVARGPEDLVALEAEAGTLRRMRGVPSLEMGYATQRLPELEGFGRAEGAEARGRMVLVLRHRPGYWGTLADFLAQFHECLDPRHAVWMWRRALGILAILHGAGWVHGDLAPEHLLVHPDDHGLQFVGWSLAKEAGSGGGDAGAAFARDLAQVAWSIRALLCGPGPIERIPDTVPTPLAELLEHACEDRKWIGDLGAEGLDDRLKQASRQAFGPPSFIPFNPGAH